MKINQKTKFWKLRTKKQRTNHEFSDMVNKHKINEKKSEIFTIFKNILYTKYNLICGQQPYLQQITNIHRNNELMYVLCLVSGVPVETHK